MTKFTNVSKGARFVFGGNLWIKQSSRTARIIEPTEYSGRWFYFGAQDNVTTQHGEL